MAEHFGAYGRVVHFSNGGCESLLRVLVILGERMAHDPNRQIVLAELQRRIEACGAGGRSFDLDQPPDVLDSIPRLHFLARLIATFAQELKNENPDPTLTDICWDRSLRLSWLARLIGLHDMIREGLPPNPELPPLLPQLRLSPADEARCQVQRLLVHELELRRCGGDALARLALIEKALGLIRRHDLAGESFSIVLDLLDNKAEILESRGYVFAAISAMREMGEMDPESRELIDEIIKEMTSRGSP